MKLFKVTTPKINAELDTAQQAAVSLLQTVAVDGLSSEVKRSAWSIFVEQAVEAQGLAERFEDRDAILCGFLDKVETAIRSEAIAAIVNTLYSGVKAKQETQAAKALKRAQNYRTRIVTAWKLGVTIPAGTSATKLGKMVSDAKASQATADTTPRGRALAAVAGLNGLLQFATAIDSPMGGDTQNRWILAVSVFGRLLGGTLQDDPIAFQAAEQLLVHLEEIEGLFVEELVGEEWAADDVELDEIEVEAEAAAAAA